MFKKILVFVFLFLFYIFSLASAETVRVGEDYQWEKFSDVVWGDADGEIGPGDTLLGCGEIPDTLYIQYPNEHVGEYITISGNCPGNRGTMRKLAPEYCKSSPDCMNISVYNDSYIIIEEFDFYDPFGIPRINKFGNILGLKHQGPDNSENVIVSMGNDTPLTISLINGLLQNITDGSQCVIESNTSSEIVCTLIGGTDNDWDNGDRVRIKTNTGNIRIAGNSHHIKIRNNDFHQEVKWGGVSILLMAYSPIIHDIEIDSNNFQGFNHSTYAIYARRTTSSPYYNLRITNNVFEDSYYPIYMQSWKGIVENGNSSYGIHISDNMFIDPKGNAITVGDGWAKVEGFPNYVGRNTVTDCGDPNAPHANCFQFNWIRGTLIEDNLIDGMQTELCDGAGIIIDWAFHSDNLFSADNIVRGNVIMDANSATCSGKAINVWKGQNTEIYDNVIINSAIGIKVGDIVRSAYNSGNSVHDNIIINCPISIRIELNTPEVKQWDNIIVKNYFTNYFRFFVDKTKQSDPAL